MSAKVSVSKKLSDASLASTKPPSPTLFLDRCLGRHKVAGVLRAAGEIVEVHFDHFDDKTPDDIWVPSVGARGWVILTKDRHIRSNQIEIVSVIKANAFMFNLMRANMTGPEMAQALLEALRDIKNIVARKPPPLVANITPAGNVNMLQLHTDLAKKLVPPAPSR